MRHVRTDDEPTNDRRRFACGIGPALPPGDTYVYDGEAGLHRTVDCPACRAAAGVAPPGTPLSGLSGQPGCPAYDRFCDIARSWGYD